jgi:hypothetical protein
MIGIIGRLNQDVIKPEAKNALSGAAVAGVIQNTGIIDPISCRKISTAFLFFFF